MSVLGARFQTWEKYSINICFHEGLRVLCIYYWVGSIDKIVLLHLLEQSSMSISGLSFANSCRIVSSWSSTMFSH